NFFRHGGARFWHDSPALRRVSPLRAPDRPQGPELMRLSGSELECVRGGKKVFSGIGFEAKGGEALLVLGPNGAGKSSLLRIIAGLLKPAAGRLELSGADPDRSLGEYTHYLGHLDPLKSALSAMENLRFWTRFLGGDPGQKPADALDA